MNHIYYKFYFTGIRLYCVQFERKCEAHFILFSAMRITRASHIKRIIDFHKNISCTKLQREYSSYKLQFLLFAFKLFIVAKSDDRIEYMIKLQIIREFIFLEAVLVLLIYLHGSVPVKVRQFFKNYFPRICISSFCVH